MPSKDMILDCQWKDIPRYFQLINRIAPARKSPPEDAPRLNQPRNVLQPTPGPLTSTPSSLTSHLTNPPAPRCHQWAAAHRMGFLDLGNAVSLKPPNQDTRRTGTVT